MTWMMKSLPRLIFGLVLTACLLPGRASAAPDAPPVKLYLPAVLDQAAAPPAGYLIINHNNIDITRIPDQWLTAAKALTFHYAHTSHGGQITSGLQYWADKDSKYGFGIHLGSPALPAGTGILKMYDGNSYGTNTYITPDMYWEGTDGLNHTRSTASTGLFDYSMWSWCGQMSYYEDYQIEEYLAALSGLEAQYPGMRFIYMTGHNDSAGLMPKININNNLVRSYVTQNNKVLFDFADIELYDPSGGNHAGDDYSDGNCNWCDTWCSTHPSYCSDLDTISDCPHTHPLFCKMKSAAFWWMMARLAGWDGSY